MKKIFLTVLAVLALFGSAVASDDLAEGEAKASAACAKLSSGGFFDSYWSKTPVGESERMQRFFRHKAEAEVGADRLRRENGPLEGSTTSAHLGLGIKKGFTYESLITTYNKALERMTARDMYGLIDIMGSNLATRPVKPFSLDVGMLGVATSIEGPLSAVIFIKLEHQLADDSYRSPAYKKLWQDLAKGDPDAFVATVRKQMIGKADFYSNLCGPPNIKAQAAKPADKDNYGQSLYFVQNVINEGDYIARGMVDLCSGTEGCLVGGVLDQKCADSWYKGASVRLNEAFPGSIVCQGAKTHGMELVDGEEFHLEGAKLTKWVYNNPETGLSTVLDVKNLLLRQSDNKGNVITSQYDLTNSRNSRVVAVKFTDPKGASISSNKLAAGINQLFPVSGSIFFTSKSILSRPASKQALYDFIDGKWKLP